jgi:hypothetical protein
MITKLMLAVEDAQARQWRASSSAALPRAWGSAARGPPCRSWRPLLTVSRTLDLNILTFGKLSERAFQLDCKFLPVPGQFKKRDSQLWSVGGYGHFGAARCVLTIVLGVAWHVRLPIAARRERHRCLILRKVLAFSCRMHTASQQAMRRVAARDVSPVRDGTRDRCGGPSRVSSL